MKQGRYEILSFVLQQFHWISFENLSFFLLVLLRFKDYSKGSSKKDRKGGEYSVFSNAL